MEQYLVAQQVDNAFIMLFEEICNKSLWADLNKGAIIGSNVLCNLHITRHICEHLKGKFDKEHPMDVDKRSQLQRGFNYHW